MHLVKPLLPSTQSLLRLSQRQKFLFPWLQPGQQRREYCRTQISWSMWSSDVWGFSAWTCDMDQAMWFWELSRVSCEFFQRVRGSCFGTFDAWGGKAARGRCCRFEEQHPLVLLWTLDPSRFAKEIWGTKRTKKDQIEENWDEIAKKRKNWNTVKEHSWYSFEDLVLLKGLAEAFVECVYAKEKQIPGWRCIMWYSKIVPNMSLTDSLLIPDQDICRLAKCELLLLAHALPGIHQLFSKS